MDFLFKESKILNVMPVKNAIKTVFMCHILVGVMEIHSVFARIVFKRNWTNPIKQTKGGLE
jgi:hypothetical protein